MLLTGCLWIGAFLLDLPNMLGWGDHTYDMKTLACSYDRVASYSFTLFFITMFVTIPLCTVVFSNVNIYVTVVKSRIRVTAHNQYSRSSEVNSLATVSEKVSSLTDNDKTGSDEQDFDFTNKRKMHLELPHASNLITKTQTTSTDITSETRNVPKTKQYRQQSKKSRERSQEIKLAKTLLLVFIAFCLCWTPYGILVLVDFRNEGHKAWYLFAILLAHTSSTLNFLIYGITNQGFRQGYKCFLRKICGRNLCPGYN